MAEVIFGDNKIDLGSFCCAIGVFDGVHIGHIKAINSCIDSARKLKAKAVAITFDPDPDELFLSHDRQRKLLSNTDRINMLKNSGVDFVIVVRFTKELASLSPDVFLDTVVAGFGQPKSIHVGTDFHFGRQAIGDVSTMSDWGRTHGCVVVACDLCESNQAVVSATRIRNALQSSDLKLECANELLGRPYFVRAKVIHGRGAGKALGFPTANFKLAPMLVCPHDGVYSGAVLVDNKLYKAAVFVGKPSTFGVLNQSVEAHLIDFDQDIYERDVVVFFCTTLRKNNTFKSLDEFIKTVAYNVEQVKSTPIDARLEQFVTTFSKVLLS